LATELLDQFVLAIQASAFNDCCRVFAPRYRQATLGVVFAEPGESIRALELAYDDVVRAFNHFLTDHSQGRPFLIAGHSQGSLHGMRLILEHVSDTPLQSRLVAAYLPGAAVPPEGLGSIRSCPEEEPASTHCVLSWQTFLDGVDATKAPHNRFEPGDGTYSYAGTGLPTEAACANPMAWTDISDSAVLSVLSSALRAAKEAELLS
jgi:hypothetical protein